MEGPIVDARGLPCPLPVMETRKALAAAGAGAVTVLLDDPGASENVARMARGQGWEVRVEALPAGEVRLFLTRGQGAAVAVAAEPEAALQAEEDGCRRASQVVILIASPVFGRGSDQLGSVLMRAFVKTLREVLPRPAALVFMNGGVRLTTEGSELIEEIAALEAAGARVLSCGTCLDYYQLKDRLRVGQVSNMFEIASLLMNADRLVRP